MCIIAYAPEGVQIADKTIERMFDKNPDGAGIMWKPTPDSQVEIRKGFMKVEDLLEAYHQIPQECEKAIHCRIATSGKVSAGCCHPFPVRPKTTAMREKVDRANMALMHNGVFYFATPLKGMKANYSDSMLFAAKYLYPMQKMLDMECLQTLIEEASSSRLLIMRYNAPTIMLGNWQCDGGVYYSNGTYKETYTVKSYDWGKSWGKYGDCYGYGYSDDPCYDIEQGVQAPKTYIISVEIPNKDKTEDSILEGLICEELYNLGFDVTYCETTRSNYITENKEEREVYLEVDSLSGEKPPAKISGYTVVYLE